LTQNRELIRKFIQTNKNQGLLTPEVVAAYAYLHLATDDGYPIMPADHHWLWLRLMCDERIKRLLIIAPPESAKTTWTITAYVGTYIAYYPQRSVIIGSTSGDVAEKRSLSLRTSVESQIWRDTFPGIVPVKSHKGLKWEQDQWSIAPNGIPHAGRLHPTVAAYGTGGSVIGSRADLLIADDLLDFDSSRTALQRLFVETWFHNSFLSRRKSKTGRAIVIGTTWHHSDLYAKARRDGKWVVCHMPQLSETSNVYAFLSYPDNWPYEVLGDPIGGEPAIL